MVDAVINNLPLELHLPAFGGGEVQPGGSFNHLPTYSYCGPGTKYDQRVAEGYSGINHLDELCRDHDAAYAQSMSRDGRIEADRVLMRKAWSLAVDSSHDIVERIYAGLVAAVFGNMSSDFVLGERRVDASFLQKYPSLRNISSKIVPGAVRSSKLLKVLSSLPAVKNDVLFASRYYNNSFRKLYDMPLYFHNDFKYLRFRRRRHFNKNKFY